MLKVIFEAVQILISLSILNIYQFFFPNENYLSLLIHSLVVLKYYYMIFISIIICTKLL